MIACRFVLSCARHGLAAIVLTTLSAPLLAANDAMLQLLEVLYEQGTIDAETLEALKSAAKADDEQNAAGHGEIKAAAATLPKIETRGKLELATGDGAFTWRIGGRVHLDAAAYSNDDGVDTTGAQRTTALAGGTDFRRARLDITANLWRVWQAKFQYDFANSGSAGIRDAWIRYLIKGPQPGYLQVGNFKEPFSLDELTSSNNDPFIEQALPTVFYPSRMIGVQGSTWGHNLWTATLGLFGESVSSTGNQPGCGAAISSSTGAITPCTGDDSEGFGLTGRVTLSPFHSESSDRVLHVGFAGSVRSPDDGDSLRFAARPESFIARDTLIDTGTITQVDDYTRLGAEAAGNYGPGWLQGEYFYTGVSRASRPDVSFDGFYVMGGWILTGESRPYKFEDGVFENPKPYGTVGMKGIGAWELVARYSALDLQDTDLASSSCDVTPAGSIVCGKQQDFTLGLNWYPTQNFKFMANWVHVLDLDGGRFNGASPDVYQVRAQAYW